MFRGTKQLAVGVSVGLKNHSNRVTPLQTAQSLLSARQFGLMTATKFEENSFLELVRSKESSWFLSEIRMLLITLLPKPHRR